MDERDVRLLEPVPKRIIQRAFKSPMRSAMGSLNRFKNAFPHEMRKCRLGAVLQRRIFVRYEDLNISRYAR